MITNLRVIWWNRAIPSSMDFLYFDIFCTTISNDCLNRQWIAWIQKLTHAFAICKCPTDMLFWVCVCVCVCCCCCFFFFTPPHNSGGVLWFHAGRLSVCPSVHFSFPDDNLSKHQWIFTKLGMCIDIVEIWFGIANGQISSIFDGVICPRHAHIFVSWW